MVPLETGDCLERTSADPATTHRKVAVSAAKPSFFAHLSKVHFLSEVAGGGLRCFYQSPSVRLSISFGAADYIRGVRRLSLNLNEADSVTRARNLTETAPIGNPRTPPSKKGAGPSSNVLLDFREKIRMVTLWLRGRAVFDL